MIPAEPFRVVLSDCPWSFSDRLPGPGRGAEKHYKVLTLAEIEAFPLPPLDRDALLFFWRVSSQVEEAYRVVRAWGFEPKSEIVWRKLTSTGKRHFGMGHYVRAEHETCIIAKRKGGRGIIRDRGVRSVFEAKVGEHSAKPEEMYSIIERLAPGPYVELFARRRRQGWTSLGDQLPAVVHPDDEPMLLKSIAQNRADGSFGSDA